jgi:hypothetical protein
VQNSYLKEMGIDVWVSRDSHQSEVASSAPAEETGSKSETKTKMEFHLCFLNYHSFGICLSLEDGEEVISRKAKQFCDDVALALVGNVRQPGVNNLKWPARGSEDSSAAAAQSVVSQRFMSLPGFVLLFGGDTTAYLPGIKALDSDRLLSLDGRQILVMNSVSEVCASVEDKRTLWQDLQRVQGLFLNLEKSTT